MSSCATRLALQSAPELCPPVEVPAALTMERSPRPWEGGTYRDLLRYTVHLLEIIEMHHRDKDAIRGLR